MNELLLGAAVALVTTAVLTPLVRAFALRRGHVDVPNERSSHARPTPRIGGWAIVAGIVAGILAAGAFRDRGTAIVLVAALALAVLAVVDEHIELPRIARLFLQIGVAVLTPILAGILLQRLDLPYGSFPLAWMAIPVTVFWIVGLTNTYNFMDGLNGIASIEAIVAGATLASLASRAGDGPAAVLALVLAAAALGFLPWNLLGGSIFMGDTGSATFGFLFAMLVLRLAHHGLPFIALLLPLLPFLLDAGITLVRRAVRGERFFSTPHRSHFYQHLQQQGWSHAAVTSLYGILAVCGGLAAQNWQPLSAPKQLALLSGLLLLHGAAFLAIELGWRRRNELVPSPRP